MKIKRIKLPYYLIFQSQAALWAVEKAMRELTVDIRNHPSPSSTFASKLACM